MAIIVPLAVFLALAGLALLLLVLLEARAAEDERRRYLRPDQAERAATNEIEPKAARPTRDPGTESKPR